jgi:AcrR family transcriptional regulator
MARWDPGTEQRLRDAALELFDRDGYDAVTVTQIAERAGITRRSYFRYFPDKREVLFAGSERLPEAVREAILADTANGTPLAAALDALAAVGIHLTHDPEQAARRRRLIAASTELQERERTKLAAVAFAVEQALHARGATADAARATSRVTTIAFADAYDQWIEGGGRHPYPACLTAAVTRLRDALAVPGHAGS